MSTATPAKTGRKQKHHTDSKTGLPVVGLTRRPDGRWRIIGTHQTFREPDEQKAIAKFRELTAVEDIGATLEARQKRNRAHNRIGIDWAEVAREILTRPKWVAKQTGIEQIGYFRDVKPPKPLPTFTELKDVWKTHFKKSKEQRRRVLKAWDDFVTTTKIASLDDITAELCITYRDNVHARGLSGKMQMNLFSRIRRLLTFAKSRAIAVIEISQAVEHLKLLTPNETTISLDPQPIEAADWKKLLAAANPIDKAMVLLMLNGAFYTQEVIRLKWSEIKKGCIITHRKKEGRCVRVCVLWDETLKALEAVPRKGEYIFYSREGLPIGIKGAEKRFRELRDDAKLPHVTSSHIRDGAATAAAEANVNTQLLDILMGHRSGMNDHYIKRNPKMVEPACKAIYKHYF